MSYGLLRSNLQYHAPLQKLSTGPWPPLQLNCLGCTFFSRGLNCFYIMFQCYGVTMSQLLPFRPIQSSILAPNILKLTTILSVKRFFIEICVKFVLGKDNLADIFTKSLPSPLFLHQRCKLIVDSSPSHLRGDVKEDT